MADSESSIAWHRAQLRKHREALRQIEIRRFSVGETAGSKQRREAHRAIADLRRRITESEHIIGAYEKRTRRPLTTDSRTLANVRWGTWNSVACNG